MRFSTAISLALAAVGLVAAQEKCPAQNILDTCIAGYKSRIDACNEKTNDWICLCDVYSDVLVCYNNCPNAAEKSPVQNQVTQFCAAAAPLRAAASASAASVASAAATLPRTSSTAAATASGSAASRASSAASATASSFQTGAASAMGVPAGAAIAAMIGAFL